MSGEAAADAVQHRHRRRVRSRVFGRRAGDAGRPGRTPCGGRRTCSRLDRCPVRCPQSPRAGPQRAAGARPSSGCSRPARASCGAVGHEALTIRTVRPARGRLAGDGVHLLRLEEPPVRRAVLAAPRRGRAAHADRATPTRAAAAGDPAPRRAASPARRSSRPRSTPACSAATRTSSGCACGSAASSSTGSAPRLGERRPIRRRARDAGWRSPARCCRAGMGLMTYAEMADRLDDVVAVIMKGNA